MPLRITALLLASSWVTIGTAQEPPEAPNYPGEFLRADLTIDRTLFQPSRPICMRFTLFNPTDETIEIPWTRAADEPDAITLPRDVIFGSSERPALFIAYQNEKPVAIRPESSKTDPAETRTLKLAPRAALGAEIDLGSMHRQLRYSGAYRVEWAPFGDSVEPVAITFMVEPRVDAILTTDYGKITFTLLYDEAPRNIENFLELVRTGFYDQKIIHRIVPGFIIQGGSPDGTGKGIRPDGKFVPAEFHDAPFELGTLAMARKPSEPDSASCQFFVSLGRLEELHGKCTVIGAARDNESLRTLRAIEELPTDGQGRPLRPLPIRTFRLIPRVSGSDVQQLGSPRP